MPKSTTVGIEVEFTGIDRAKAKDLLCEFLDTKKITPFMHYNQVSYAIKDKQGRTWKMVYDGSINSSNGMENTRCELVSPILDTSDDEDLSEFLAAVNLLKKNGGFANESCGLHVHVGAGHMTARGLKNLSNLVYSRQNDLFERLNVGKKRKLYCKKLEYKPFIKPINEEGFKNKYFLNRVIKNSWYQDAKDDDQKTDTRYHALNLHSLYEKGTVEFRLFNGTMDTNKIKAYANLCKNMVEFSDEQALISHRDMKTVDDTRMNNEQFTEWLDKIGVSNKTDRKVLLNEQKINENSEEIRTRTERLNNRENNSESYLSRQTFTPSYQM